MSYYLEDLTIREIKFLNELLETYKKDNEKPDIPLSPFYHSFRNKLKRLCKFIHFNPLEENTPKQQSKYSLWKKQGRTVKKGTDSTDVDKIIQQMKDDTKRKKKYLLKPLLNIDIDREKYFNERWKKII
jgi:hypothetical protein